MHFKREKVRVRSIIEVLTEKQTTKFINFRKRFFLQFHFVSKNFSSVLKTRPSFISLIISSSICNNFNDAILYLLEVPMNNYYHFGTLWQYRKNLMRYNGHRKQTSSFFLKWTWSVNNNKKKNTSSYIICTCIIYTHTTNKYTVKEKVSCNHRH